MLKNKAARWPGLASILHTGRADGTAARLIDHTAAWRHKRLLREEKNGCTDRAGVETISSHASELQLGTI